ncbi:uncharacterized protein [Elaeis guineensis]|uniref:Uncharacterized protein LOC105035750 isoform X2 n=1 Tax=Elaeis guineensis var. tenera TaxID=51953 RepID=A0A6J0PES7_ELAGV|nr:uncharacterized protein LOC105035750 isoform X2 [Elaeis guineensis]
MDFEHELPFEAGQEAESKCFIEGFRGAWFRCKITKIGSRKGHIGYYLEFFDFPDERITWTRLYQKSPQPIKSGGESKMELMVELLEPPLGEGRSYVSSCKDLRPSLDWSPENGWMVPISRNYGDSHYSARLVRPHNEGVERIVTSVDLKREEKPDFLNKESILNNEMKDVPQELIKTSSRKDCMSSSDSEKIQISEGNCVTSSKDASDALLKTSSRKDQLNSLDSVGKIWISESNYVTSRRHPDTIESSIIELEEVANKIKWLKGFLRYGFRWSNKMKPSWRFVEK